MEDKEGLTKEVSSVTAAEEDLLKTKKRGNRKWLKTTKKKSKAN